MEYFKLLDIRSDIEAEMIGPDGELLHDINEPGLWVALDIINKHITNAENDIDAMFNSFTSDDPEETYQEKEAREETAQRMAALVNMKTPTKEKQQ